MGKRKDDSGAEIQRLLEEKTQIEHWLERIGAAGGKTPKSVRAKVESDYRKRLEDVLGELEGFSDGLTASLAEHQERRDRMEEEEEAQKIELAEAELRYTVGEYDETKWNKLRIELEQAIERRQEERAEVEAEVARLDEVLRLIAGGPEPEPEPEPTTPVQKEPARGKAAAVAEVEVPEPEEEIAEVEPEEPVIPPMAAGSETSPRSSQQTDAFDEMKVLKSVTEDEASGPSSLAASGKHRMATDDLASPDLESARPPAPETAKAARGIGAEGVQPVAQDKGRPVKGTQQKSVKCADCGALNLPTEWYCERCGAELAAL